MAKDKPRAQSTPPPSSTPSRSISNTLPLPPPAPFFPLAQYTSLVGVYTALLAFTALFLPQTPPLVELTSPYVDLATQTSRDRPQHPFLEALTRSPLVTVGCLCAGMGVLQVCWGAWVRGWWVDYHSRREEKETRGKIIAMMSAWMTTLIVSLAFHVVLVLFGAPIASHVPQTYLLALLLSLLTVYTPSLTIGAPAPLSTDARAVVTRMTWARLFAEFSLRTPIERALVYPAIGTFLGCWLGVIPIALGWDRPWQAWPLTPAFGAVLGHIVASLSAVTVNATCYLAEEHLRIVGLDKKTS